MTHSRKNLLEVEDAAVRYGLSEMQEARFARRDLSLQELGLTHLTVKPGRREAFAHRHLEAEELYVVLSGAGSVKLDEEIVPLVPLDAVRVGPGTARQFEAGPGGLVVLILGRHVEGDVEQVPDLWSS